MSDRLLLIGNGDQTHIGAHLLQAAQELNLEVRFLDVKEAFKGPKWTNRINWWFRGHRPTRLREFSFDLVRHCEEFKPRWMLAVGLAPIEAEALRKIGLSGIQRLNYLTDDPWNATHKAAWFLLALSFYDHIFSVRRSNLTDLKKAGPPRVSYLPFAYAPELHYPEPPGTAEEKKKFDCDIVFIGGADRDRLPYIKALIKAGFEVRLYGGYWDRFPETKSCYRGYADPPTFRKAIGGARVSLCLIRHANRDDNSMRTFEIPAMSGCMLTEATQQHREIFGQDGEAAVYFQTPNDIIEKLKSLLNHEELRVSMAKMANRRIATGKNTYKDRLKTMLHSHECKNGI